MTPAPGVAAAVLDSGVAEHADVSVAGRVDFTSSSSAGPVFRDEFPEETFDGSSGSQEWSTPWMETGEADGSGAGLVRVQEEDKCASGHCLVLGRSASGYVGPHGAERECDLTGVAAATLTYSYLRRGGNSGGVQVEVEASTDGGTTWVLVAAHFLDGTDDAQATATVPLHEFVTLSHQTRVRFTVFGQFPDYSRYLYVDNVEIEATGASHDPLGHGTHVAGIIGGTGQASSGNQPGVAPGASIHAVQVLDGQGMAPSPTSSPGWTGWRRTPPPPASAW